jgi:hypothetical protein
MDVNPVFGVPISSSKWGAAATTIPGAVLYDPINAGTEYDPYSNPYVMRHELAHAEQQAALGPGFWLAYGATGGRAFEPYDPLHDSYPLTFANSKVGSEGVGPEAHNMDRTWMPEDEQRQQYPLFRVEKSGGSTSLHFMPGYPRLINGELR